MRKNFRILLTLLASSLLSVSCLNAATGGPLLEVNPDARSAAMGGAYCAVSNDAACLYFNPAGLGGIDHSELSLTNNQLYQGMNQQYIGFVYSLRDVRSSNVNSLGTIAGDISFFDGGKFPKPAEFYTCAGDFSEKATLVTAAYGRRIYEIEDSFQVLGGAAGRLLTEETNGVKTNNMAFDAGALVRVPLYDLSFGVAVQNIGNEMDYDGGPKDLPSNVKTGAAALLGDSLLLAVDVNNRLHGKGWVAFGTEYVFLKTLALRAGYSTFQDECSGLSAGLGIKLAELDFNFMYAREMNIDYAYVAAGDLGETHRVTLLLKLGAD